MRAYKFLDPDGRAPFTGVRWEPDHWVEAPAVILCRDGVHACTPDHLSHWLAASLWEVELDGEIVSSRHKVAASRGRLVRRIDAYAAAVRELAEVGAWRCRDHAVEALRATGDQALADRFAAAATLQELLGLGESMDDASFARTAGALAVDAAHFALHGGPSQSPFVSACSAGHVAAGPSGQQQDYDRGYGEERAFQSAWLTDRLGLAGPGA